MARNWTAEERQKQAKAIRKWKPWKKSTGPRSEAGKTKISQNSYKHGMRSATAKKLLKLFTLQRRFVTLIGDSIRKG